MKVQPIMQDEIQTFKALITIHKVLQEGHPSVLKEAQNQESWLRSLERSGGGSEGARGYGPLIREYVYYLLAKLAFHRQHSEFNGTFEYEEYISLKATNDPNEGYETITDLMTLQDQIESFQKLIFSHFRGSSNNECRIAALVPLVQESYGIYKFLTSMLRAMHITTDNAEILEPLRGRYDAQHHRLVNFYYECSNLRYLTSLITVPKLPQDPPNLIAEDVATPGLPSRPAQAVERPPPKPATPPIPRAPNVDAEPINAFWEEEQQRMRSQQQELERQRQQQLQQQEQAQLQNRRDFEAQTRMQQEQQRLSQEQLMRDQYQQQTQGRLADLERENLAARNQYDRDQMLLGQYDQRVKALEIEMGQTDVNFRSQQGLKDDQIKALQEQINTWRTKYEALAKLYSQLRKEHLDLLAKFKSVQLKAASAQEAMDEREKMEREIKTKNLELADMIRERDRALHDMDRVKGGNRDELEKLKRELRLALDRAENSERSKGSELSAMLSRHNREMADLEETIRHKQRALDEVDERQGSKSSDLERLLRDKEDELETYKTGMDDTLLQLHELQQSQKEGDSVFDSQLDQLIEVSMQKVMDIIDSVLLGGAQRVDEALYELDSPMQAGNQNSTPAYLLSQVEKASSNSTEFATAFNNFIADGPRAPHSEIIKTVNTFAGSISDVLSNTKGITRLATDDKKADVLVNAARQSAASTVKFFTALQSFRLQGMDAEQKTDHVINANSDVQVCLKKLTNLTENFGPKSGGALKNAIGDLGDLVDREMTNAAKAIEAATEKLTKLMARKRGGDRYSTYELKIHDSILEAAISVTNAIAQLIKAATASQQEIVAGGKGSSSRSVFYKRNNRWTEGLISAAKAVANSTNLLIETADGVISGRNSPEQLIVASNDVAASTAQLVAASRVKASLMSKSQERLETASKGVTGACRSLVRQVQKIIADRNREEEGEVDYGGLSGHEFKTREMETKVEILQLENSLNQARHRLVSLAASLAMFRFWFCHIWIGVDC